ncbi:MAG: glycosyltransferase [Candidatus Thorarchaeota archaeon]
MILVTVGSSLPHDDMVRMFDELVGSEELKEEVVAQIGAGMYIPKNIEYFRFSKTLEPYYKRAEIVVSNCGAGTILENTTQGRKLIAVQNPDITGGHEWELVTKMEKGLHLIWCKETDDLMSCIQKAKTMKFEKFDPEILSPSKMLARVFKVK